MLSTPEDKNPTDNQPADNGPADNGPADKKAEPKRRGLAVRCVTLAGSALLMLTQTQSTHIYDMRPAPVPQNITADERLADLQSVPAIESPELKFHENLFGARRRANASSENCSVIGTADHSTPARSLLTHIYAEASYTPNGALLVRLAHDKQIYGCIEALGGNTYGSYSGSGTLILRQPAESPAVAAQKPASRDAYIADILPTFYHELQHFWQHLHGPFVTTGDPRTVMILPPLQTLRFRRVVDASAKSFSVIESYHYRRAGRPLSEAVWQTAIGYRTGVNSAFIDQRLATNPAYVSSGQARKDLFAAFFTAPVMSQAYDRGAAYSLSQYGARYMQAQPEGTKDCDRQQRVQDVITTDMDTGQNFAGICRVLGACDQLLLKDVRPTTQQDFAQYGGRLVASQCTAPATPTPVPELLSRGAPQRNFDSVNRAHLWAQRRQGR